MAYHTILFYKPKEEIEQLHRDFLIHVHKSLEEGEQDDLIGETSIVGQDNSVLFLIKNDILYGYFKHFMIQNIQKQFIDQIRLLNTPYPSVYSELWHGLTNLQGTFFSALARASDTQEPQQIHELINAFRSSCRGVAAKADKKMGYGWMARTCEVIIKAIGAFFVSIGMAIGSLFLQGFASTTHRQWYKDCFFSWSRTPEQKSLDKLLHKQVLGSEEHLDDGSLLNQLHHTMQ